MIKHIVVIGGGPAGYVGAIHAATHGAKVTLIEAAEIGGTCLNQGCIPTKTLVATCSLLEKMRHSANFGIQLEGKAIPRWEAMKNNMNKTVNTLTGGVRTLLADRGVTSISGFAHISGPQSVMVEGHGEVNGDFILVCTGSHAVRPSAFPFDDEYIVTSDELLQWETLPRSLVIVGDGVIACEFAFIMNTLGVDVTVIGMGKNPLPTLDHEISALIGYEMRKKKIRFVGNSAVRALNLNAGSVTAECDGDIIVEAERALVAVGRRPNTSALGLDAIGLKTGALGELPVDEYMRSQFSTIYAAGDVTGRVLLAHAASAQARVAVDHMLGLAPRKINDRDIPLAVFTSPEIGCVGLTENEARNMGINVRCGAFNLRGLGKAQAMGELSGMVKVVAEAQTGRLLGLHIVGAHASDLVHEGAIVLRQAGTVEDLEHTIHAHPTLAEGIQEAAEDVFGHAIHKILPKRYEKQNASSE
jgi:dihydrolipoamide dehydrogenase